MPKLFASVVGKSIVILIFTVMTLTCLSGCAALSEGKLVTKDGKTSPFNPMTDRYAPPKDPMSPF